MGRGPSVVACPEEKGKGGGGGEDLACCPVSTLPALLQPIEGTLPTADSGLHWPWGVGVQTPECTFLQWPLGAVSPPPSGPLHSVTGTEGVLGLGMGKWGDGDGVKERNGSKKLEWESGRRWG